jgi:hypothetical protein
MRSSGASDSVMSGDEFKSVLTMRPFQDPRENVEVLLESLAAEAVAQFA